MVGRCAGAAPCEKLRGEMPGSTNTMAGCTEVRGRVQGDQDVGRRSSPSRREDIVGGTTGQPSSSSSSSPPATSPSSSPRSTTTTATTAANSRRGALTTTQQSLESRSSSPPLSLVRAAASSSSFSSSLSSSNSSSSSFSAAGVPGVQPTNTSWGRGARGDGQQGGPTDAPPLDNQKHLLLRHCKNYNNNNNNNHSSNNNVASRPNSNSNSSSSSSIHGKDSNKLDTLKPKAPPLVPSSPPTPRNALVATSVVPPLEPSKLSKIRQSHLANRRREQLRSRSTSKLPELSEHSELDPGALVENDDEDNHLDDEESASPSSLGAAAAWSRTVSAAMTSGGLLSRPTPQISVTDDDDVTLPVEQSESGEEPVTPSLPDSFLRKLGLAAGRLNKVAEDDSVDTLSEKEVEGKFITLSLAFKTDKLTVDQRVAVQERSRDLAEQNVDKELQGLRTAAEALNDLLPDSEGRDVIQRIQQHIDVLEQAAARVSSRAEVFGAVQQERRMCKAMEVMVTHTENLRRIREREQSEVQEARKLLSERTGHGLDADFGSSPGRRSMSVCAYNAGGRALRRRSEVALPRVLGGVGSPSMTQTSSLENLFPLSECSKPTSHKPPKPSQEEDEDEDAKARFQSAVASTSMQHAVTATMRRVTTERRRSVVSLSSDSGGSPASPVLLTPPDFSATASTVVERLNGVKEEPEPTRKISNDEEAYRKGFEEGLKTQLSQDLDDLRDQQSSISQDLENVMDRVEQASQDDTAQLIDGSTPIGKAITSLFKLRESVVHYDWRANKNIVKSLAGILLVFLAIVVMFFSPPRAKLDAHQFSKPGK